MTLEELLQCHLDYAEFTNPNREYCWFCLNDVTGKNGPVELHAQDCLGVQTQEALAVKKADKGATT